MKENQENPYKLLEKYVRLERLRWHAYASEAILKGLAKHLNENEENWGVAGLLHDLDIEITNANMSLHTIETAKILNRLNYPAEIIEAIELHNEDAHNKKRSNKFHYALAAGESLAGFIAFCTSANHQNNIYDATSESIYNSLIDKDFAKHFNKSTIFECQKLAIEIKTFIQIGLNSMQGVAGKIGLNKNII